MGGWEDGYRHTLVSLSSLTEQLSIKACATTDRQASIVCDLLMSNKNSGFFKILTQNLRTYL